MNIIIVDNEQHENHDHQHDDHQYNDHDDQFVC